MKIWAFLFCFALTNACAIGRINDAVDKIEATLEELHAAECTEDCGDEAGACWEEVSDTCIEGCKSKRDLCEANEKKCLETNKDTCDWLEGSAYIDCWNTLGDICDGDCSNNATDCASDCGDEAMECITGSGAGDEQAGLVKCMASCMKEFQDSLKGLEL